MASEHPLSFSNQLDVSSPYSFDIGSNDDSLCEDLIRDPLRGHDARHHLHFVDSVEAWFIGGFYGQRGRSPQKDEAPGFTQRARLNQPSFAAKRSHLLSLKCVHCPFIRSIAQFFAVYDFCCQEAGQKSPFGKRRTLQENTFLKSIQLCSLCLRLVQFFNNNAWKSDSLSSCVWAALTKCW